MTYACTRVLFFVGFLAALSQLTAVGDVSKEKFLGTVCPSSFGQFLERFFENKATSSHYYTIVIEDTTRGRIAAAGTILVEQKFVHMNGLVRRKTSATIDRDNQIDAQHTHRVYLLGRPY